MVEDILRDDIEYTIHCDEKGKIIGPLSKAHAHLPGPRQVLTHYSTWAMVFHPKSGRYGLQRKNPKKHDEFGAGKWDMGIAGHNCYVKERGRYRPMNFAETLVKEGDEEVGVRIKVVESIKDFRKLSKTKIKIPTAFIFEQFHYLTERNNEFVGLAMVLVPTIDVKFNDNEVIEFKWLLPSELAKFIETNHNYCDPLPLVFEKAERFRKKYLI